MFMVAPSGIVKEEILRDTPISRSNVSIDSGIVALDVAVEKAKPITGKNFLIKVMGLRPVKPLSIP